MMNKSIKILSLLLTLSVILFSSCKDDEVTIELPDGPIVSDGFYIIGDAAPSATPVASTVLTLGQVEAASGGIGAGASKRSNYYESYLYLDHTKGGIQFVKYTSNETVTYGGTTKTVDMTGDEIGDTPDGAYLEGTLSEGGAAVTPLQSGLHHVVVDFATNTFLVVPIINPTTIKRK